MPRNGILNMRIMRASALLYLCILQTIFHGPLYSATERAPLSEEGRAQQGWRRVVDRQGSSVDVPPGAIVFRDGEVVVLRIEGLSIRFWTATESRRGFPGHSPAGDMDLKRTDCDTFPPNYRVIRNALAAYSCEKNGNIDYYVARYSSYGGVFLFATYPKGKIRRFNNILARMSSSMSQVARTAGRCQN